MEERWSLRVVKGNLATPFKCSSGEKQDLTRKLFHRSSGLRPVTLDKRASMRGPTSSRS
jgi:hypothetical protein